MDADRRGEDEPAVRGADDVARQRQQQGGDDDPVEHALDESQERQLEQEEADVAVEDRVGDRRRGRERDAVDPEQDGLPRPRHRAADDDREEQRQGTQDPACERSKVGHVGRLEDDRPRRADVAERVTAPTERRAGAVATGIGRLGRLVEPVEQGAERATPGRRRRRQAAGQPEVAEQHDERDEEGADAQPDRRGQPRPEDRVEADARVPQDVGPQVDPDAEQQEDAQQGEDDQGDAEAPAGTGGTIACAVIGTARAAAARSRRAVDGHP